MRLDKRRAVLAVVLPALVLLGLTTQAWATGTASDVLSGGAVAVPGGRAAPGVIGLVVVTVVALLGAATGGRAIRALSVAVAVLAAAASVVLVAVVVIRPEDAVAAEVARQLARTTPPAARAAATPWAWLALVAAALLTAGALAVAWAARSWAGLPRRYERRPPPQAGPRGEARSAWDEITEGRDPTLGDGPQRT
ncbi:MAG TPA: Trp biosynthesis-associated membrane protein [Intrasporangium sp.]|uniref:Trp biosynthesis-associated membrane protein n=1 Tax=Intrasporangium sp. TaxID=1925024 RepID=UPI002D77D2C2|nr:Trp biosynthesis-associated membrane protein [Intrasporangium sp.]HET7398407.1 Trp biosynthesis-associated membrane protein [Intrasporangium sp.]